MTARDGSFVWKKGGVEVNVLSARAAVSSFAIVREGEERLLVDAGDGALTRLIELGVPLVSLGAVALTHGHYDHCSALFPLLGYMRTMGRTKPLVLVYPPGAVEIDGLLRLYDELHAHKPFEIDVRAAGEPVTVGPFTVTGHPVVHWGGTKLGGTDERVPATAYSVVVGGIRVFVSGDCGSESELDDAVRGADLALVEATFADEEHDEADHMIRRVHLNESCARRLGSLAREFRLVHRK